jgi:hypothetical protein
MIKTVFGSDISSGGKAPRWRKPATHSGRPWRIGPGCASLLSHLAKLKGTCAIMIMACDNALPLPYGCGDAAPAMCITS